ncbi:MAG: class I SAM-dependent methyltransferase [Candidatus Omnitrophica bacterium]|nr:class I SAM-dependent methyltransferase [Candidatus Omnitrophota bacterium]
MKIEVTSQQYQRYVERIEFYKEHGYDIESQRKFIFESAFPFYEPILEIGTGKGYMTLELAQQGYSLISIDISRAEQDFAQRLIRSLPLRGKVDFRIYNAESMPFPDATFKTIFCVNSIHHFDSPGKVLTEALRVLRREGKCILSDFTKKGMQLIHDIHQMKGKSHSSHYSSLSQLQEYCPPRDYMTKMYSNDIQEVFVIESR